MFHQARVANRYRCPLDHSLGALPWQRFKFRDQRGGNALLFRIQHDSFGERMLGKPFHRRGHADNFGFISLKGMNRDNRRLALCDGARLIEHHGVYTLEVL